MRAGERQKGVTMIEVIIVTTIVAIILGILFRIVAESYPLSRVFYMQARSTENARYQLKRMAKIMREARESATGGYPLVEIGPQKIVLYADLDSDMIVERIRYELVGTDLVRGVTEPSGEPLAYDINNEVVTTITRYVRNGGQPIFTYYNGNYPADSAPLTSADMTDVKYIAFKLIIDTDVGGEPDPIEVVSQVQLRNLKVNLGET